MKNFDHQWRQLTALARQAPDDRDASAPHGLATRVAALAFERPSAGPFALFERLALRGLLAAGVVTLGCLAYSFSLINAEVEDELVYSSDPVAEVLDAS